MSSLYAGKPEFSMLEKVRVLEALGYKTIRVDVYEKMRKLGRRWLFKGPAVYYRVDIDDKTYNLNEVFRYEFIKATWGEDMAKKAINLGTEKAEDDGSDEPGRQPK